jgi:nucleoid-associated protein YgaU
MGARNIGFVHTLLLAGMIAFPAGQAGADGAPATCPAAPDAGKLSAVVTAVNVETRTIVVQPQAPCTIIVSGGDAQHLIATLSAGDTITAAVAADGTSSSVQRANRLVHPGAFSRGLVMLCCAALVAGLASLLSWRNPLSFIRGLDGRLSNSQTQLALWSLTALTAYLATVTLRIWYGYASDHWGDYVGGVGIPENVLAMSGLSALSFGGARAVTAQKVADRDRQNLPAQQQPAQQQPAQQQPNQQPPQQPAVNPKAGDHGASLTDLFRNDGDKTDIGDTQMILITLIAVVLYVIETFAFLGQLQLAPSVTLPDIDTTLLSGFGVGQAAYLAKKAGSKLGEG